MRSLVTKIHIAAIATGLVAGSTALAGFSTINPPAAGEIGHLDILNGLYGGSFTQDGVNFINGGAGGTVNAMRIDDFGVGADKLNLVNGAPGLADDQIWDDGVAAANARAVYAGDSQSFGYFLGESGGAYNELFSVSGSGFAVSGNAVIDFSGATWRWGRGGNAFGPHSSLASENADGRDHMVTYKITGLPNTIAVWLLFWEDRDFDDPRSDFDYNDLVVEIRAIPTPMAAGLGFLGLGGLAGMRRRPMN